MYAGVFMQIDSKDGTGRIYLCTCDADVNAKQLHGGVSFVDYLAGHVFESITIEGSADISGGNGFFAAPAGGEIVIADDDGTLAVSLLDGSWGLIGGRVYIAHRTQDGVMHKLYQLLVTEAGINDDGSISITCKTPSAEANAMMHKSAAVTQLLTGPDDPANPTDPTYLEESQANVIAGTALGGVPVSLKSGDVLPVCRIAFFKKSSLAIGAITGGNEAKIVSSVASRTTRQELFPSGNVKSIGVMMFDCRGSAKTSGGTIDHTEQARLVAQIQQFIDAGYRIILSNGGWFLDVTANTGAVAQFYPAAPTSTAVTQATSGQTWGTYDYLILNGDGSFLESNVGVWFALANAQLEELVTPDDIDPEGVSIYAVPKNIPVAGMQVVFDGVARNKTTIPFSGDQFTENGVSVFRPMMSSDGGFVSSSPVKSLNLNFAIDTPDPAWTKSGGIEWIGPPGGWTGTGNIEDIKTDPGSGWNGGAAPAEFHLATQFGLGLFYTARMRCRNGAIDPGADFYCAESTWRASYSHYAHNNPGNYRLFVAGIFDPKETLVEAHTKTSASVAGSFSATRAADKTGKRISWRSYSQDLKGLFRDSPYIQVTFDGPDSGYFRNVKLEMMEAFVWAFYKIGFQSIYSTIYPFWIRKNCGNLAYGAGTLVAGGAGRGTQIQPNGEIAWEPFDLPVPFGSTATVTGTAYGTVGSTPYWLSVGYTQAGATQTPACWISDDDGATWRQDAAYQTTSIPTSIRSVNGQLVATRTDGSLDIVVGFSSPNMIWSTVATGATQINDITFGVGTYVVVGNGGQARYSTNLSSWIAWNWSGGDDLLCACYSQSGLGGYFHVGVDSGLVGTIYRKYDGSDTWTAFPLPLGDKVTAIMDSDGDVVAMNPGSVYARSPGLTDAAWKDRYSIGDNSGDVGGVAFSVDGANHLVVGANAQILTSPSFLQGSSFEATYAGAPDWTPWGTKTPSMALDHLIVQKLGGTVDNWNPVRFSRKSPLYSAFGVAFDPPSSTEGATSGTTVLEALRKICKEWWCFSGDMPAAKLDGSADAIEAMIPDVKMGNREDVYTQITAQYQPFGGEYLGRAYIQNVDKAYVAGNDALYFGGWDLPGANTFGLLLWQRCRDAYLATGILRETSLTFDSVQDAATLGALWAMEDQDLGERILWLCRQPRYYRVTVRGNESAAALANVGCRYKPNATLLTERGLGLGITGYGVVVESSHDPVGARHELLIAFPPEQPA